MPSEPAHAGEQLRAMRERALMTVEEVAARAGVDPQWLASIEAGVGTHDVLYSQWLTLVRATQPPRPDWWDEGHEHDLHLPPGGHHEPATPAEHEYWTRIERVRSDIREQYRRGRPVADRPDRQLEELCRVLNDFGVRYLVFGSQVARLNGVPLETLDVDVVPQRDRENIERLAAALNSLHPR